jgi:hypothetical protein
LVINPRAYVGPDPLWTETVPDIFTKTAIVVF